MFACVAGPAQSPTYFAASLAWTFLHQLQCNISNQYYSVVEDAGNKPWRPLPAGRITLEQAFLLHAIVTTLCLVFSATYGWQLVIASLALTVTTVLYDRLRMSGHYMKRVLLVVSMYGIFEYGATVVISACASQPYQCLTNPNDSRQSCIGQNCLDGYRKFTHGHIHHRTCRRLPRRRRRRKRRARNHPYRFP